MTFYQGLATVLLRVWAATMLVKSLRWVIDFTISWSSQSATAIPETARYLLGAMASGAIYLALALAIWICAIPAGRWVGGAVFAAEPAIALSAAQIVTVGSFLIGLFIFVQYAPQAIMDTVIAVARSAQETDAERLHGVRVRSVLDVRELIMNWAVVFAALALALRARDLGRLFAWLRVAGLSKPEQPES